jgi:hypothetical protein
MNEPTPDKVMQLVTGGWACSILGAAARHGIFTALEGKPETTDHVAEKTGISPRGAQALLDGLTGLGLLTLSGGTLVINDFVLSDQRTGHPFAMMFASQMLVMTKAGSTYRQSDYRAWLREAGFKSVDIVPTGTPSTLVFAS